MPVKLLAALILLALNLLVDLSFIADGVGVSTATYVRVALGLFLIAGLIRGSEAARTFALFVAVLNLLAGTLLLFQYGSSLSLAAALFGVKIYFMIATPFVFGGYLLWCMKQEDVKTWLYKRAYGKLGGADE